MTAEGFERLVRRYRSEIFRTVLRRSRNREDAEDLTQITFLNAYTALQRGAEPEAPRAWLHAIARNAGARSFHERRLTEVELDADAPLAADDDALSVNELQAALARLPFNQRASLLMREVGGLSANEIGARLGISPGAVATLLFRARRALRAALEEEVTSRFGRFVVLYATLLRQAWVRLVAPILDGGAAVSRSVAAVGLVAGATGVAVLTGGAPLPAQAGQVRPALHASAAAPVMRVTTPNPKAVAVTDVPARWARVSRPPSPARPAVIVPPRVVAAPAPPARLHRAGRPAGAVPSIPPVAETAAAAHELSPPTAPRAVPSEQPAPAMADPPEAAKQQSIVSTVAAGLPAAEEGVTAAPPAVAVPDVSEVAAPLPVEVAVPPDAVPVPPVVVPPPLPPPPLPPAALLPVG